MPKENEFLIHNGQVITPEGIITPGYVTIEDSKITAVGITSDIDDTEWPNRYDAQWNFVLPGFIDLHLQGGFGKAFFDVDEGVIETVSTGMPAHGVTGFIATTALIHGGPESQGGVEPIERLREAIDAYDGPGAEPLGIHVEGPFLNVDHRGGFLPKHILEPDPPLFEAILEAAGDRLRMMTMAPEKVLDSGFIRTLIDRGIVAAVGHTGASAEVTGEAVTLGMHYATHLFNAMAPFHHREPGPVGAVLTRPAIVAELIADGCHVHPEAMRLAVACKGVDGIAVATDGSPCIGLPDGTYERWGFQLTAKDGTVTRIDDNTLVGTAMPMARHLRNLIDATDLPIDRAVRCLTSTPARVMGLESRKGALAAGYDADITMIRDDFEVVATWCRGAWVFGGA